MFVTFHYTQDNLHGKEQMEVLQALVRAARQSTEIRNIRSKLCLTEEHVVTSYLIVSANDCSIISKC